MVFSSLTFLLLFLPLLYLCYFPVRSPRWRNGVLIVFSLLFYGWGEPIWIIAMLFSTLVNYTAARLICSAERTATRRLWLVIGVIASVIFLFYFKYAAFLFNTLTELLGSEAHMAAPKLPIGISFYTFQILTYTVDVYRGKAPMLRSPLRLLLYICCFPQLIAGPIVQYGDVADQLDERTITPDDFSAGIRRFSIGLAKKVLLANVCGAALEGLNLAGSGSALSVAGAWLGAFLYTLQIYFDFSAYSDMAIGLGKTLGFTYKENFDYPYASGSITEFWRRWHISLGSFFRDYIYIPLGGNRCGTGRTILNMLIVWTLTGFWHGASWNFMLWGAYYGVLLILERFVFRKLLEKLPGLLRRVMTLFLVLIGWVIFYYTELPDVWEHLNAMFAGDILMDDATRSVLRQYTVYPLFAFLCSLPVLPALRERLEKNRPLPDWMRSLPAAGLLALSLVFLIGQSYNPFIYFRF